MSLQRFNELVRMGVPLSRADHDAKFHKGGGTTTQSNAPPAYMVPYLKDNASEAMSLYDSSKNQEYLTNPFGADTLNSFSMLRNFSNTDPTYGQAGMDSLMKTANGEYLNGNPNLDSILNKSMDQTNAMFQGGGRYGSAGHAGAMASNLGSIRYQDYANERQNMMDASKFLPLGQGMLDQSLMGRIGAMQGVGGAYDQYNADKWNFGANNDWNNLMRYASIINPGAGMGGTSTTTAPGGNKFAGAAGGALAGAQLGSVIPGIGTAIGAGIGGLGGLFFG